jgi:predicted nucleic acid-binding protein
VRFWDASAVLPLLLRQPATARIEPLLRRDPEVVLWWGTAVECASALARARRHDSLSAAAQRAARALLERLRASAYEVQPGEELRARAARLLDLHTLRAAEALQLAAALVWCRERPQGVGFVSLDGRLREAAAREGFSVYPYSEEVHEAPAPGSEYAAEPR